MLGINLFFDDPILLEKISSILEKNGHHIKVRKFLTLEQLTNRHNLSDNHILVANYNSIDKLTNEELSQAGYTSLIMIDEEEEQVRFESLDTLFVTKEKPILPLMTYVGDYIENFYQGMEFIPIDVTKLKVNFAFPVDFFLRIREGRFLKIYNEQTHLNEIEIKKINEKYENLYIQSESLDKYIKFIKSSDYSPSRPEEKQVEQEQVNSVETLNDAFKQIGISPIVVKQSEKVIDSIKESFNKDKFVTTLIKRFDQFEGNLLHKHSYLAGVLAMNTSHKFTWMTSAIEKNIFLGCILHDIGMKDPDNITNEKFPKSQIEKLPKLVKEDILGHTTRLLKVLEENPKIHQDVISMVKNHHAVHDIGSYPHHIAPSEISLPFALFMLSHEASLAFHKIEFDMKRTNEVVSLLKNCFAGPSYKKVLPEFVQSLEELASQS